MNRHIRNIASLTAMALLLSQSVVAQSLESESEDEKYPVGSVIHDDVLDKTDETNLANALYGQLLGLYVMQNTSATNVLEDQATFSLRGNSTFGNNAPLILIDGIQRNINNITPSEIAKVEVLKDAVASAIYGVQGANGIINITTKRGEKGFKAKVRYSSTFETPFRTPEFVEADQYATLANQALIYEGADPRYTDAEIAMYKSGANRELYPNVDWQDAAYRDFGQSHIANMEFSGGGDNVRYYTNLDYSNTSGVLNNTELNDTFNSQLNKVNVSLLANIDAKLTSTTTFNVGLIGRIQEQTRPGVTPSSFISYLYNTPSGAFPIATASGQWGSNLTYGYNPIAAIGDTGTVKAIRREMLANMRLTQDLSAITDGLYATVGVNYDNSINFNDNRTRPYQYEMLTPVWSDDTLTGVVRNIYGTKGELGWNSVLNDQYMTSSLDAAIGYDNVIGDHSLSGQIRYEQIGVVNSGRNSSRHRQSIMATANYNYSQRYTADLVVNYSGTSVLEEGSQFEVFPAIGLGWIASNESFLEDSDIVDYLKVRSSFGYSGSDLFAHDLFLQSYGIGGYGYYFSDSNTNAGGLQNGDIPVSNLKTELSRKFDFGVDATLWNSLNLSATYFNENRSRILVSGGASVSGVIGSAVPLVCNGEVKNQGVEFALNYSGKVRDFGYKISGNVTYAKNEILNNNEGYLPEDYLYKTGGSLDQYYGLQSNGLFNSADDIKNAAEHRFGEVMPGDVMYVDQNGDNVINENDIVRLGYSSLPEIYYGFDVEMSYKGFSFFAQFQGVGNRSIYLNTPSVNVPLLSNRNISTWYVEDNVAWTPQTAATANLPRLTTEANENNYQRNDIWMANGNFLKLRNVEVAYTFDREMLGSVGLKLFVRGANLFSVDSLGYADPENYGVAYPTMQSFTLGANLMF